MQTRLTAAKMSCPLCGQTIRGGWGRLGTEMAPPSVFKPARDPMLPILEARKQQIHEKGAEPFAMACERPSLAGSVGPCACVFCGSRVVLYPIADAVHLVHGPIIAPPTRGTSATRAPRVRNCTG